jgi:predicted phage terminase large subunit-like protein
LVLIGQRVHADDVSGLVLGEGFDYTHLMIPWEYDPLRQRDENDEPIKTPIGWFDPRTRDRESAWPERFSDSAISRLKAELGPYGFASQFQQSPAPRGGGIIQREWFKAWDPPNNKYPPFTFCMTAVDCAATQKASSDFTGCTTWAIFIDPNETKQQVPAVILVDSWRRRLQLSASETIPRLPHEVVFMTDSPQMKRRKDLAYMERCGDQMGLVEWVAWTAKRFGSSVVLIEHEKTGLALGHELRRLNSKEDFNVWLQVPKGDKYSRLLACQALFANGRVYAPIKPWAEELIDEVCQFPFSKYKDLTDSTSMALTWLRNRGLLQLREEVRAQEAEDSMYENVRARHRQQHMKLYPC